MENPHDTFRDIIDAPAERARLLEMGAEVAGSSPAEFADFMAEEMAKIGAVVRAARISMDGLMKGLKGRARA